MPTLPSKLIEEVRQRIANPNLRHGIDYWIEVGALVPEDQIGCPIAPNSVIPRFSFEQFDAVKSWAEEIGNQAAPVLDETEYPLAAPATEAEFVALESVIGRPLPEDLRQLFAIANGGWGPGSMITPGHGTGFLSTEGAAREWNSERRYYSEDPRDIEWPDRLLPIADVAGTIAYDLDSARIVLCNDHYEEHGLTADEAFPVVALNLSALIDDWLGTSQ